MTGLSHGGPKASDERIEEALLALPEHLRAGAAVVEFQAGQRVVLREGANRLICQPDDPDVSGIAIWCYDAYARRWYPLEAEGNAPAEVGALIAEEIVAGKLEWPFVAVNYNLTGRSLNHAVPLTVVYVPYSTGESIEVSEERDPPPTLAHAGRHRLRAHHHPGAVAPELSGVSLRTR